MFFDKNRYIAGVFTARAAMKSIALAVALTACTPAFNWRDVSFDQAGVTALLPCKPDRGTRAVQLGGQAVQMSMAGCEAGGAMFTVSLVQAPTAQAIQQIAQDLQAGSKASHSRQLLSGSDLRAA
jgi:hypothetical protein